MTLAVTSGVGERGENIILLKKNLEEYSLPKGFNLGTPVLELSLWSLAITRNFLPRAMTKQI